MPDAYVLDAVHTPRGKRGGSLAGVHPVDLYTYPLNALVERNRLDPREVEDVVTGCVSQTGEQGSCLGRAAVLAAGWPIEVPGLSLDRFCSSGLQALHFAAMAVQSGNMELVVAGGVESMSRLPIGSSWEGERSAKLTSRFRLTSQYEAAEAIAARWKISRRECDEFATASQQRAARAWDEGRFDHEICPVPYTDADGQKKLLTRDEHMRPQTTVEVLSTLKPVVKEDGVVTAGNASGVVDGASAALVGSLAKAKALGLKPRARVLAMDICGGDPEIMLTGPIPATRRVLQKAGLKLSDIDLFEINEAFAPIPLCWMKELGVEHEKVNVNGGAIALGHPLGATGCILVATILNELERRDARYGLITICMGYGMGIASILDRKV